MDGTAAAPDDGLHCDILIVDDDQAAAEEFAEAARMLGYGCRFALDAPTALRLLAEQPSIGIVVTDVQMPGMCGLSLLDEIASRFAQRRPIVTLVVTGFGSVDVAVAAMRNEAADFLTKPIGPGDVAASLRRAMRKWLRLSGERTLAALTAPMSAPLPAPGAAAGGAQQAAARPCDDGELLKVARKLVKMRERRGEFLNPELFSDPSWDILLDLASARLEGKQAPVSSVCQAARVPMSTALRQIRNLVDMGLVRRWSDPDDRRRDLLEIEDGAMDAMRQYFAYVHERMAA